METKRTTNGIGSGDCNMRSSPKTKPKPSSSPAGVQLPARRFSKIRDPLVILLMSIAVVAVYWSPAVPDSTLVGLDYSQLHLRRMQFARDALFRPDRLLPGWYPRELLGTPFWSNTQNFPFIPTRLLLLLTLEPTGPYSYVIAVSLSAVLAALFTYLYMRTVGFGLTGSAAAAWTFACSGYFASRVAAGHLPLLEAYPSLPLLLWVIESLLQAQERDASIRRWICAAAFSTTCVMLAGHPQLPVYAIGFTGLYSLWRVGLRHAFWAWGSLALGVGIAAFSLVPMVMLVGRSTRVLVLDPPLNDVSMPYRRLAAFFFPWRDGTPPLLDVAGINSFHGYPNLAYFWDTVCYMGLLPWIAAALLLGLIAQAKLESRARKTVLFATILGAAGIILALPFVHKVTSLIPGTIFRSPARLIYLTEFALAMALGVGVHSAITSARHRVSRVAVPLLLIIHMIDLGGHDRQFIFRLSFNAPSTESEIIAIILKKLGDSRFAIDYSATLEINRAVDDIGFFDSIMLARPYRTIMSLADAPPNLNVQTFNGSEISSRALAALGVKYVLTTAQRDDLKKEGQLGDMTIYSVPFPSQRAEFFDNDHLLYLSSERIHTLLRNPKIDLRTVLLLPHEARHADTKGSVVNSSQLAMVEYRRPDSDHIECTVMTDRNGYLRIIESWDPGWSATVDGKPAPIVPALDALIAVPIGPGRHEVRLIYRTPGAAIGQAVSILSLALLCILMWKASVRRRQKQ